MANAEILIPSTNWRNMSSLLSIEGRDAHVLDNEGKDVKWPIAEKIARSKPEGSKPVDAKT